MWMKASEEAFSLLVLLYTFQTSSKVDRIAIELLTIHGESLTGVVALMAVAGK
jgi:hypothetical protein